MSCARTGVRFLQPFDLPAAAGAPPHWACQRFGAAPPRLVVGLGLLEFWECEGFCRATGDPGACGGTSPLNALLWQKPSPPHLLLHLQSLRPFAGRQAFCPTGSDVSGGVRPSFLKACPAPTPPPKPSSATPLAPWSQPGRRGEASTSNPSIPSILSSLLPPPLSKENKA